MKLSENGDVLVAIITAVAILIAPWLKIDKDLLSAGILLAVVVCCLHWTDTLLVCLATRKQCHLSALCSWLDYGTVLV